MATVADRRRADGAGTELEATATLPVSRFASSPGSLHLTLAPSQVNVAGLQAYVDVVEIDLAATATRDLAGLPFDAQSSCGGATS